MNQFIDIVKAITPLIAMLAGMGLVVKYVPSKLLGGLQNELIPWINALLAFFTAFGPAPAQAGIFGGVGGQIGIFAKLVASGALSIAASGAYEVFLRPLMAKLGMKNNEILVGKA